MGFGPQIPGLDNRGTSAASSTADGTLLTSAQTLSSEQQAQVRTNLAADATQCVFVSAATTASQNTDTYTDSDLILPLAVGTHRISLNVVVTSQNLGAEGAGVKLNFSTVNGLSPTNPILPLHWDYKAFSTASWPGDRRTTIQVSNYAYSGAVFRAAGNGVVLVADFFLTVATAGNFSIQTAGTTNNANIVSLQGGSFLAATRYG